MVHFRRKQLNRIETVEATDRDRSTDRPRPPGERRAAAAIQFAEVAHSLTHSLTLPTESIFVRKSRGRQTRSMLRLSACQSGVSISDTFLIATRGKGTSPDPDGYYSVIYDEFYSFYYVYSM